MPSRERLNRLWTAAEKARDRGHYRLARRILRILLKHDDPALPDVRLNLLEIYEVRGSGPPWRFTSMSNAKIDRLYSFGDDDPADRLDWWDREEPEEETFSYWDMVSYSLDIREGEDAADQLEERMTRQRRGKGRWRAR